MMNNFTFTKTSAGGWELNYMVVEETKYVPSFPSEIVAHIEAIASYVTSQATMDSPEILAYKAKLSALVTLKKGSITQADIDSLKL